MTELREESVKHFRLEDGTYMAVQYQTPVHYLDENGYWQNIDNTLSSVDNEYSTSSSRVKFAKKINGSEQLLTLQDNKYIIMLSLNEASSKVSAQVAEKDSTDSSLDSTQSDSNVKLNKLMTLDNITSSIKYEDILENVDLEYILISNDVKENIIVKSKCDSYIYSFTLQLNNLKAFLSDDGTVVITTEDTGEVKYIIPTPYMYDSEGNYSYSVRYTLTDNENGKYTLTVSADSEWMNSADRKYPVTIDPPIYVASGATVTDTYINSYSPTLAPSSYTYMYAGSTTQLYWKTSTLPTLPDSAYITKSDFTLKIAGGQGYVSGKYLGAYQVTTDWDSTLNWTMYTDAINPQGVHSSTMCDLML